MEVRAELMALSYDSDICSTPSVLEMWEEEAKRDIQWQFEVRVTKTAAQLRIRKLHNSHVIVVAHTGPSLTAVTSKRSGDRHKVY